MNTAQSYVGKGRNRPYSSQTVNSDPLTVDSDHISPNAPNERPALTDEDWHRQQLDKATHAVVVTVNSFFDLEYEELTPVRVMGNLLKHWLTTEYKDRIRQVEEEDWEISHLDNHLSAMLDTMGFLSLLECQQRVMELFERDLRSTQTGLV